MSTDLKVFEAQIPKIIKTGGLLGSLLSKLAGPLMKVAVPLANNIVTPLGITAGCRNSKTKIHGSVTTTLIISNKEMNDNKYSTWNSCSNS